MFLSSHTLSEVERVAHRVAILRGGRLVALDTLENLRQVAVRRLEVEFGAVAPTAQEIQAIPGVRDAVLEGSRLTATFAGSADPLVKALARYEVREIRSREDDLEEIFLRYYRDEAGA
ncbi:MAG: hypothetical protein ACRDPG_01190 [Nocardioidaceae bacterium]